jgi:hypothetical protein
MTWWDQDPGGAWSRPRDARVARFDLTRDHLVDAARASAGIRSTALKAEDPSNPEILPPPGQFVPQCGASGR